MQRKKKEYDKRNQDAKEKEHHSKVAFIDSINKDTEECTVSCLDWTPTLALPASAFNPTILDVQQGACVYSGSPVNISNVRDQVNLTQGPTVYLNGIVDGVRKVECADVHFPTVSANNKPVVIQTSGRGLYFKGATSKILSLALLLKSKYKVHFETGREGDPQYGGTITCPDDTVIIMVYDNGKWRLPMLTANRAAAMVAAEKLKTLSATTSHVSATNPWQHLLDTALAVEPLRDSPDPVDVAMVTEVDRRAIQHLHNKWCHPSNTKMEEIYKYYRQKGFPKGFLEALKTFRCKICDLCKGARNYRTTKRMAEQKKKTQTAKKDKRAR